IIIICPSEKSFQSDQAFIDRSRIRIIRHEALMDVTGSQAIHESIFPQNFHECVCGMATDRDEVPKTPF
ncbi:MAG: hypothetical protein IJW67_02825, partial [Blautia sp.]|nr:hypothetical protein [Blautia sp.]